MRTDVKVGLICVFAVILAVVIYFVAQGNSHPREARAAGGGAATQARPVSPAASTVAVAPAMAPAAVPATGPAAGTMGELVLAQATPSGGPGSSLGGGMISPPTPGGSIGTPTPAPTGGAMVPNTTMGSGAGGLSGGLPTGGGLLPTATAPAGGTTMTPGTIQIESGAGRTGGTDPFNRTGTNAGNPRTGGGSGSGVGTGNGFGTGTAGSGRTGSSTTGGTGFGNGFGNNGGFPGTTSGSTTGGGTANFGTGIVGGTGGTTYTIQKGDMLGAIAKARGTTVKAIEGANPGIDATRLKVGKVINVPAAATVSAAGGTTTKPVTTKPATTRPAKPVAVAAGVKPGSNYTVKKGDTLAKIAASVYGDKNAWRRIFRANRGEISSADVVPVGTVLRLPQ